jgi:hypothetical protein
MKAELLEVLALQPEYSAKNTSAMQRRGVLIRKLIPAKLKTISERLKSALGPHGQDLDFQGKDGMGRRPASHGFVFFQRKGHQILEMDGIASIYSKHLGTEFTWSLDTVQRDWRTVNMCPARPRS